MNRRLILRRHALALLVGSGMLATVALADRCRHELAHASQAEAERAYLCEGLERGAEPTPWMDETVCT